MTTKNEMALQIIKDSGIDKNELVCTGRALAMTIVGSNTLSPILLPKSLQIINSEADTPAALVRAATDEAFVVANIRALALFLEAKLNGTAPYRADGIEMFYDIYKNSSDADKKDAIFGTARILDKLFNAEINRVSGGTNEQSDQFDLMVAHYDTYPMHIFEAMRPITSFLMQLAIILTKDEGVPVELVRITFQIVGGKMTAQYDYVLGSMIGATLEQVLKAKLRPEDFEKVDAALELSSGKPTVH